MASEKKPVVLTWDQSSREPSFEAVLDATCERLREKHIQYSIQRIGEMDEELKKLEEELDDLIARRADQSRIQLRINDGKNS